jgi:hypothetical protein
MGRFDVVHTAGEKTANGVVGHVDNGLYCKRWSNSLNSVMQS